MYRVAPTGFEPALTRVKIGRPSYSLRCHADLDFTEIFSSGQATATIFRLIEALQSLFTRRKAQE